MTVHLVTDRPLSAMPDPDDASKSIPRVALDSGTLATLGITAAAVTDRSGSITTGGTSQQLMAANPARKRAIIQNPPTAAGQNIVTGESLFINFVSAAGINAGTSIELAPGASFDTGSGPVVTEAVTVNATTVGHRWVAKELV